MPDGVGFGSGQVLLERAIANELHYDQFNLADNDIFVNKRKVELSAETWPTILGAIKAGTLTVSPKAAQ